MNRFSYFFRGNIISIRYYKYKCLRPIYDLINYINTFLVCNLKNINTYCLMNIVISKGAVNHKNFSKLSYYFLQDYMLCLLFIIHKTVYRFVLRIINMFLSLCSIRYTWIIFFYFPFLLYRIPFLIKFKLLS